MQKEASVVQIELHLKVQTVPVILTPAHGEQVAICINTVHCVCSEAREPFQLTECVHLLLSLLAF